MSTCLSFVLAQIAKENPSALRLATILFGVGPCPKCDYVHTHCKCSKEVQ